jgi:hypothetical protein
LGNRVVIDIGVLPRTPDCPEVDSAAGPLRDQDRAPPIRYQGYRFIEVTLRHYYGDMIKYSVVAIYLEPQPPQRIRFALYLVANEMVIDNRDIGTPFPVLQTQFVEHQSGRLAVVSAKASSMKRCSDFCVIHGRLILDLDQYYLEGVV